MPRYTFSIGASGVQNSNGRQNNGAFLYLADDAAAEAARVALNGLINGRVKSVTKQLFEDLGPYEAATAHGGSDRAQIVCRNAAGAVENVTIPFVRQDVTRQQLEAFLESNVLNFENRSGGELGEVVKVTNVQIIDGA